MEGLEIDCLEGQEELRGKYHIKCVTGASQQSSFGLLARVHEIRIVHLLGSIAHAAKSCHSNVEFCFVHIFHHSFEIIRVVVYTLVHVREVRAENTDIIV